MNSIDFNNVKNLIFTAADDVTFDWLKFERVNSKRDATSPVARKPQL